MKDQPLYNPDDVQRFPFEVTRNGKRYQVAHVFGTLADETLIEYDRRCEVRYGEADKSEADGGHAVARSSRNFAAAVWLWLQLIQTVEGYGPLDGIEWKEKIPDKYKAAAVDTLLTGGIEGDESLPEAEAGEFLSLDGDALTTVRLRSIYSGREVITSHTMREPNADLMARFQSLNSRSLIVKGRRVGRTEQRIPSKARPLAKLYDELCDSTEGYAGRVPLHHKVAVISYHMNAGLEALEGN